MALLSYAITLLCLSAAAVWWKVHVPSDLPRDLPKVPIYVSLLGLWSKIGQDEIFEKWLRKPLEEHGAVRFWFAGRWSILTTKPQYLTDLFRNKEVYAKAGNQKKIPWSVSATLLGDNIISAHGEEWRVYTSIMKPGMTKRIFDTGPLVDKSNKLIDLLLQSQSRIRSGNGVLINPLILRYAISVMSENFLDFDFRCLEEPNNEIASVQTTIKMSIFKPLYLNFPVLDKFPSLFRSRKRAFFLVRKFENLLCQLIHDRPRARSGKEHRQEDDQVIHALERALKEGQITERQYRDNLKITFIVAHENSQLLMNSMFYQIGANQEVQNKLRAEVLSTGVTVPTADTVNNLPYLTSVILELLRLYPPISQLTNRITTTPTYLGGVLPIPSGTYIGWNAYGVQTSNAVWGPQAKTFLPERWGKTVEEIQLMFRRETVQGTYIPFNAYTRKCLGQGFVLLQIKIAVFELVRRMRWTVDSGYQFKLPGGGVLAPVGCKIVCRKV